MAKALFSPYMKQTILLVLGFFLFFIGILSLVMMSTGLQLSILVFIDYYGRGLGLLIRLIMIIAGIMLMYLVKIQKEIAAETE